MDAGNDRFNLMILCWNEGQSSAVHDHADSHCFMKVLKGGLSEVKYAWPQEYSETALISSLEPKCADIGVYQGDNGECEQQLQEISRSTMNTNEVCYINGNLKSFDVLRCAIKLNCEFSLYIQTTLACIGLKIRATPTSLCLCISTVHHLTAATCSTKPERKLQPR